MLFRLLPLFVAAALRSWAMLPPLPHHQSVCVQWQHPHHGGLVSASAHKNKRALCRCRAAIACRVFFFGGQERERYFSDVQRQADIDKWFNPVPNTSLDQPDILRMEGDDEDPNRCAAGAVICPAANTIPLWAASRPACVVCWIFPPATQIQALTDSVTAPP